MTSAPGIGSDVARLVTCPDIENDGAVGGGTAGGASTAAGAGVGVGAVGVGDITVLLPPSLHANRKGRSRNMHQRLSVGIRVFDLNTYGETHWIYNRRGRATRRLRNFGFQEVFTWNRPPPSVHRRYPGAQQT